MINWILQKNLTKPKILKRIKSILNGEDEIWEEVVIIPFSNEIPAIKNKDSFTIIYGSTTFMLNAFKNEQLKGGVFFDPEKFQMSNYVKQWQDKVLNHDGQLLKFGEIQNFNSEYSKKWFIRPNNDGKGFSGSVYTFGELKKWSKKVGQLALPNLNSNTEVWISEPKEITKEWRLFIVDNQIVSASRYMHQGKLDESDTDIPEAMLKFANQCIHAYKLEDIYVMDVAQSNNKYKLIECNCFNGTGFYSHDIEQIVKAVNAFVRKKLKEAT